MVTLKHCLDSSEEVKVKKRKITHFFRADKSTVSDNNVDIDGKDWNFLLSERLLSTKIPWRKITRNQMDLDYAIVFSQKEADILLKVLEEEVEYYTGDLSRVKVYGKWHQIPRKQSAFGDDGLKYKFSGNCLPAKPWLPVLKVMRDFLHSVTKHYFNFVLVNRYNDGNDYIGEHRDDEKDLVSDGSIASISLGQPRDFVFRHESARHKATKEQQISGRFTLVLEHGSILMMNPPTNKFWYHSLPVRKGIRRTRINLTFRQMIVETPKAVST